MRHHGLHSLQNSAAVGLGSASVLTVRRVHLSWLGVGREAQLDAKAGVWNQVRTSD